MAVTRKVTWRLPAELVDDLPELAGKPLNEAIIEALEAYGRKLAAEKRLPSRDKVAF